MAQPLARNYALLWMLRWARRKRGETAGNNAGWFVEMLQRADRLPGVHYAWCQSTCNGAWRLATGGKIVSSGGGKYDIQGGRFLADGTASVGLFLSWARARGYVKDKPARADHVCFHVNQGDWPYHVGMISRVISVGPVVYLETVEGNTSYDGAIDMSDPGTGRDAVVKKRRVKNRGVLSFVRIPGIAIGQPPRQ